MILYKNNIIITPPKTGTNTLNDLMTTFYGAAVLDDIGSKCHMQWHSAYHKQIKINNKTVYLLVRNPYDRLISFYYFFVHKDRKKVSINDHQALSTPFNENTTFAEFIDILYIKRKELSDILLAAPEEKDFSVLSLLIRSLSEDYKRIEANGFIRVEYLEEDLQQLGINLKDLPTDLPEGPNLHLHKSENRPANLDWSEFFTPEVLKKANTWCEEDAVRFGYTVVR
jgi:hypothetical protein